MGSIIRMKRDAEGSDDISSMFIPSTYTKHIQDTLDPSGINWLHGKKASDCISQLHSAVRQLGTVQSHDWQAATPGDAGLVLSRFLTWAKQYPDAVFEVA